MPDFHAAAQFFPIVIAPGVVAYVRRRWPGLVASGVVDGIAVWTAVVFAAVVFSLLTDFAFGLPVTIDAFHRGVLLGLTSATAHTLASGKGSPPPGGVPPAPAVQVDDNPTRVGPRVDPSTSWGPDA